MTDPFRQQIANMGIDRAGGGFNPYAAGPKRYGITGRANATSGPISPEGMQGYDDRDMQARAKRTALLNRMQATQKGQYMNPAALRGM